MTGAIPRRFERIPLHKTAKVRANRREPVELPVRVTESGHFLPAPTNNHSAVRFQITDRISFGASESIFDQVVRIVLVFPEIIPGCPFEFLPVDGKEVCPWILLTGSPIVRHHRRDCSECDAVSAVTRSHKLVLGILSDVWQVIWGTNDLSRPAMIDLCASNDLF